VLKEEQRASLVLRSKFIFAFLIRSAAGYIPSLRSAVSYSRDIRLPSTQIRVPG
jgi:hypothetical protein